jgi:hypothetical protein
VNDRTAGLESSIEQLRLTVLSLQHRVDVLEATLAGAAASEVGVRVVESPDAAAGDPAAKDSAANQYDPSALLSLVGRLLLVLAGGFFLRALTDSGTIARPLGLALGFAYALLWLVFADRAGARKQILGAGFHALPTAMIAFPLLIEAATRFKVLTGPGSAVGLAIATVGLLLVAWRQQLRAVAWVAVIGAVPTSMVLLTQTGVVAPFAIFLIAFGVATVWLAYALDWWGIRWPVALAADIAVAGVTLRVLAPEHQDAPQVAVLLQLTLVGAYVGSIAIRTLLRARNVTLFEVAQTAAALVVGFGGAVYLTRVTGIHPAALGAASLVSGAACYGLAVAFIGKRADSGPNVYYYTSLALVLVLVGCVLILDHQWLGVVFVLLAVLAAGLWSRFERIFLLLHSGVYLVAGGIVSGAITYGAWVLAGNVEGPWARPVSSMWIVLVAAAVSAGLATAWSKEEGDEIASGLRLAIIGVFVWVAGACVIGALAPVAGSQPDGSVNLGVLATVRTGVLALATLLVAWIGRHSRFREWGWLVYPLLVAIGLKMMTQDFKFSRPSTLFIAMALYGAALIVAPRLRRARALAVAQ